MNPLDKLAETAEPQPREAVLHICLDIETGPAPESAIETSMRFWKAPATIKDPVKIEAARQKAFEKSREKSAVLDGAPIGCVSIVTETSSAAFSCIPGTPAAIAAEWVKVYAAKSEKEMLIQLRDWLDSNGGEDTAIVGHNLIHFDLPKLRNAYIKNRLTIPAILQGRNPVYDTMREYIRSFTTEHEGDRYVKLAEIQAKFGLKEYKDCMDGAEAARLIGLGQDADKVLAYCWLDTMTTYQAFLHMTGQMPDETEQDVQVQPSANPAAETAPERTAAAKAVQPPVQPSAVSQALFDPSEDFIP